MFLEDIIIDNILRHVLKSTVLKSKYFGGYYMKLLETGVYCTNFSSLV